MGPLPLYGLFYDEVIPFAVELIGSDEKSRFFPKYCEYLFEIFHFLNNRKSFDGSLSGGLEVICVIKDFLLIRRKRQFVQSLFAILTD